MLSPTLPPPPPPPPPIPPPIFPLEDSASSAAGGDHHSSYNPSILIIAAIIATAIIAVASIHLLLRVVSRSRSAHFVQHLPSTSSSTSSSSAPSSQSDQDPKAVIDSLPLFSLSSSPAKPSSSSSSLDCAVCLSPFQVSDELRLLPACRHVFHSQCIDTWLKSSLSCPLCRSPISPIPAVPPSPPPPAADHPRSESFRVEIGSVSHRTDDSSAPAPAAPHARSYSLGSSFEYVVEEEIEAVLARVVRRRPPTEKSSEIQQPPPPPGEQLAELAGGSHRSWLRDYVDRLASSASSSFSSLRFSQRGSHRFDSSAVAFGGEVVSGGESWDLERNLHLHLEEEDGGFSAFYRWLVGA